MYVRPCRNCPHKKDCEIKAAKLAIVRPAGLSSINFRCAKRLSLLPPGQRIEFDMADSDLSSGDWDDYKYTFTGIVMKPRGSKILVWLVSVDDDEYDTPGPHPQEFTNILRSGKNPISLSPNRVRPVEGRVNVCSECGQPEGTKPAERKGMETFCCWKCQGWECCYAEHA